MFGCNARMCTAYIGSRFRWAIPARRNRLEHAQHKRRDHRPCPRPNGSVDPPLTLSLSGLAEPGAALPKGEGYRWIRRQPCSPNVPAQLRVPPNLAIWWHVALGDSEDASWAHLGCVAQPPSWAAQGLTRPPSTTFQGPLRTASSIFISSVAWQNADIFCRMHSTYPPPEHPSTLSICSQGAAARGSGPPEHRDGRRGVELRVL